jgi:hypothetical protein
MLAGALVAARVYGTRAALATALLLAANILWTPSLTTECLYVALFTTIVAMIVITKRDWKLAAERESNPSFAAINASTASRLSLETRTGAAMCGLLLALALFTRPITICLYPILIMHWALGGSPRRRGALLAWILAPTIIALLGWGWRNYAIFGEPVWLTTNLGHHNAWEYDLNADRAFAHLRAQELNEAQINSELLRDQRQWGREHPREMTNLFLKRIADLMAVRPTPELEQILWHSTFDLDHPSLAARIYRGAFGQYWPIYALGLLGIINVGRNRRAAIWIALIFVLFIAVHAFVSRGDMRLAAPLYPLLCIQTAAWVAWMPRRRDASPAQARALPAAESR